MTDTEQERIKAICKVAHINDISDLSDGYHTFKQLYYQRMMLFAVLVKQNRDKAWKSLRHEDGELCFGGGWFIVGIDTPKGSYTYHYEDNYFSLFDCVELERGKAWDGHTEKDVTRLLSLDHKPFGDCISRQAVLELCEGWWLGHTKEDDFATEVRALPSVTPAEKVGHWEYVQYDGNPNIGNWHCSECRVIVNYKPIYNWEKKPYHKFCPNCGAKMEVEHERRKEVEE